MNRMTAAGGVAAMALAVAALLSGEAAAQSKPAPFVPPHWPSNIAPVDWPGNPGTRYEMPEFVKRYPKEDIVLKVSVAGWQEEDFQKDEMGRYTVGDRLTFSVVPGDRNSQYFGSVKDGRDGGKLQASVLWMDATGQKVLREDTTCVRPSCATCNGLHNLYFDVPAAAPTGRHRLRLTYRHEKLGLDLAKDLYFHVLNDGSWDDRAVIDAAGKKYPTVLTLQEGQPCDALNLPAYAGTADVYILSPNAVPDRRMDDCNFGTEAVLQVGNYGLDNRALVRFDLSVLPASVTVEEAHLQLYLARRPGRGGKLTVAAYEVLKPWGEGAERPKSPGYPRVREGEACWQTSASPAKWEVAGVDGAGKDRSEQPVGVAAATTQAKGWVSVPLDKEMVNRWIRNAAANHGVLLMDPKGTRGDFHSSEFEDSLMHPRLVLALSAKLEKPAAPPRMARPPKTATIVEPEPTTAEACPVPATEKPAGLLNLP